MADLITQDSRFTLRHGANKPDSNDLQTNELGFATKEGVLYIKHGDSIRAIAG